VRVRFTYRSFALIPALLLSGCGPASSDGGGAGVTRLSIATGGTGGVYYPYGGGIAKIISQHIPNVEATAEVTAASVDNLKLVRDRKSDMAFTTADTLAEAVQGTGPFEGAKLPLRAIAMLYVNYTQVVTLNSSGIEDLVALRGKVVSTGSPGSGGEVTAFRILESEGIDPSKDIRRQSLAVAQAVEALRDGKIDAFFWSGGLPTASISDLAHTSGIKMRMLPNDRALEKLQKIYGEALYVRGVVPRATSPGLQADVPVVSVPNLIVVHEGMAEPLVHDITRVMFERQADLAAIHPEANNLKLASAVRGSPAPFHPGAIRYYRERQAWPE
jgi:TRAP transporter TAXI family solute receptor